MDARQPVTWALVRTYLRKGSWKLWRLLHTCWAWILCLVVVICFIGIITPILGNKYLPPRHLNQPKAPYGFSLVDPQNVPIFPSDVDIIFVHGLGAFPDTTWQQRPEQTAHAIGSEQPISWIREFLAQDLRQARLMSFNYDSTTYNDAPQKNLQDIGTELLQAFDVSRLRKSPSELNRSIIFLCHSYGGLVVKEAGSAPTEHLDVLQNTHGIIFLGTPHRGTKYSYHARAAALLLNRLNANPDIFLPLKVNSSALLKQHASFMDRYGNLDMVNFYETRALPLFHYPIINLPFRDIIVEKFSATFENATNAPIDSHHSGLNKFNSRKDPGYRNIRHALQYMIDRIIKKRKEVEDEASIPSHALDLSTSAEQSHCSQRARLMVPRSTVHTFTERPILMDRVVSNLSFPQEFRDPPRSIALWGIGGSGKSQLALRFIEKHRDDFTTIIWIDAQSPESATRSYSEAFEILKLVYPQHVIDESRNDGGLYDQQGISTDNNWIIRTVKEWLESTPCKWLVVIDNADNLPWIHDIMPKGRMGSIIITSRDRIVHRLVNNSIHVDKMSTEEALDLLLRSASIPSSSSQQHIADSFQQKSQEHQPFLIVDQLGYLALAINLAGAYISQHDFVQEDLSRYLDFLGQNAPALLGNKALSDAVDYDHTIATVWETSFTAINKTSPASALLLTFLACLSGTRIDDRLFDEASLFLYQRRIDYPTWKVPRQALLSAVFLLLVVIYMALSKMIQPWKLYLEPGAPVVSSLVFIIAPIMWSVFLIIQDYERMNFRFPPGLRGNSVMKDYAVLKLDLIVFWGFALSVLTLCQWLPGYFGYLIRIFTLPLIFAWNLFLLGFTSHRINIGDQKVALRSRRLLDQLDFSLSNKTQFSRAVLTIPTESESARRRQILLAWIVLLYVVAVILSLICRSRIDNFWRSIADFREIPILGKTIPEWHIHTLLTAGILSGFVFAWPLVWRLWNKEPPPFRISPALVNSLLTITSDGQWNRQPYSELMVPLTRFNLMQREAGSAYSMHVLVRWWALNRLPLEEQQAWAQEVDRLYACPTDPQLVGWTRSVSRY